MISRQDTVDRALRSTATRTVSGTLALFQRYFIELFFSAVRAGAGLSFAHTLRPVGLMFLHFSGRIIRPLLQLDRKAAQDGK